MNLDSLRIKPAEPEEAEFLANVILDADRDRLSEDPDWDEAAWLANLRAAAEREVAGKVEHSITSVIVLDGERIGRLRVILPGDEIHVAGIQIHPSYQGKGIGSKVLGIVIEEAETADLPVTLEVGKDNPDAKRLYERLGFQVAQDRKVRELMRLSCPSGSTR